MEHGSIGLVALCRQTGRSYKTVHRMVQDGRIPAKRCGGRWCIKRTDLQAALDALLVRLSLSEAAELTGTDYATVYQLARERRIPAKRSGRRWYLARADLHVITSALASGGA